MNNPRLVGGVNFGQLQSDKEKIEFILNYAVLAPSNHNAQPWLFRIKENSCEIFYDPSKKIIEADPEGRDMHIGFGCLIENLVTAAEYFNVFDRIDILPGSENLIAEAFFKNLDQSPSVQNDKHGLLKAIVARMNARGIFQDRPVSQNVIEKLSQLDDFNGLTLHLVSEKSKIQELAKLTERGLHLAYEQKSFRREMAQWINNSFSRRREGIPGYSLRMPLLMSFVFPSFVRNFNIGKKVGALNYKSVSSAPLVSIITSSRNDPKTWIDVGRLGERLMLHASVHNLKTSIFIAAIEMGDLHRDVAQVIKTNERPQFLMCIGYLNTPQGFTLRHSVKEKLIS